MIQAYFDGAVEPVNPGGHLSYGFLIKQNGTIIKNGKGYLPPAPDNTNNVAEYLGAIEAIQYLLKSEYRNSPIELIGDSALVIYQLMGRFRIKKGKYTDYALQAKELVKQLPNISFRHIKREFNEEADKLTKDALMENGVKVSPRWIKKSPAKAGPV